MDKKKIGIIGATGYTGSELVRLLVAHPQVSISIITSESKAGQLFSDIHPQYRGIADIELQPLSALADADVDLVFLALPHGVSMDFVRRQGYDRFKVVDLSGDFRLGSADLYEQWYHAKHEYPQGLTDAVYGLPELFREQIRPARLVANPGCYPTSALLPLAPLVRQGLLRPDTIIVDAKSGVTGAGARARQTTHYPDLNDNFAAYGIRTHRHTPEIQHTLAALTGTAPAVLFTPHLLPVNRGILSTTYSVPSSPVDEAGLRDLYRQFYASEPFVRLVDTPPSIKNVRGSNYCDIFVTCDDRTGTIITVSVIDNLVKGAAGQAVQNMNLMFGWEETAGLLTPPLAP